MFRFYAFIHQCGVDRQTNRQTNKHADTLITILSIRSAGEVINPQTIYIFSNSDNVKQIFGLRGVHVYNGRI